MAWLGLAAASATQTVSNFRIGLGGRRAALNTPLPTTSTGRVEYLCAGLESATDNIQLRSATVTTNSPTEYVNIVRGGLKL